jgi:hypothetical protein
MSQIVLLGGVGGGNIHRLGYGNPDDNGTFTPFVAVSQLFAAPDWTTELAMRYLVVVVSANAGIPLLMTPILEGAALDGTSGQPDCRVAFAIPVPTLGRVRSTVRVKVGLFNRIRLAAGQDLGRTAFRGAFAQFRIESTGAWTLASGETDADVRFDGVSVDYSPLQGRIPTVGPS